jgi:ABC-type transport system involved in cytochrome c biogenesis ATPase subunit
MSKSPGDDWVLDEAEALLDMDGRRERLERIAADLQSGQVQLVGHAAARDRIEKHLRDRHTP